MTDPTIPPRAAPRGRPLLAWLVIAGVVGFIVWRNATSAPRQRERVDRILIDIQMRYFVGTPKILKGKEAELYDQAKQSLNRGSYSQRLRFAVVAGELAGPKEAIEQLQELRSLWTTREIEPSEEEKTLTRLLLRLYQVRAADHPREDDLTEEDRQQIEKQLGWLGKLVLLPHDEDALAPAQRTALVLITATSAGMMAAAAGLVVLLLLAGLLYQGQLHSGLGPASGSGGVYAETFALWMVLYVGLSYVVARVAGSSSLIPAGLTMVVSLATLAWPVWRGLPWAQVRQELGLHAGRNPLVELGVGVGTYLAALPMLGVGVLIMLGWQALQKRLGIGDDPFGPSSTPSHPIVEALVKGGWGLRIQVFLAATVLASLVEEIVFRGLLYRHLRDVTRTGWTALSVIASAVVTSLVFAIIHPQGMAAVPGLMGLAFAFCLAREWRGSLLPAMVAHGINNGVMVTLFLLMVG